MLIGSFFGVVALLYYGCFVFLAALTLFIAVRGRRTSTHVRLRRVFCLLALSLLVWQATLFGEVHAALPLVQLWLGRANFAAVVFATSFALRFVQAVPVTSAASRALVSRGLPVETVCLGLLALLTPWVTASERVEVGHAITRFGPLFPLYLLHVLGCLTAALITAWLQRQRATKPRLRGQLTLLGLGMLVTGGVSSLTNVVLPYGYDDFRFCDVGPLSTVFFALAVAYATFLHGLFDLRIVLRETLVYGLMMVFVLSVYSAAVFLITEYLTDGTDKVKQFVVLVIAFLFDPLRRVLEEKTDRLLFGVRESGGELRKRRRR